MDGVNGISVFDHFVVGLIYSSELPPLRGCICALILEGGGVPVDAENSASSGRG